MKRNVGLAITVLVGLSFLLACAPAAPTAAPAPPSGATVAPAVAATKPAAAAPTAAPAAKVKRGGTFIYATTNNPNDFDNVTSTSLNAVTDGFVVYETLLNYELVDPAKGKFELKPQLADSWDMTDPTKIVFKLHKGVRFHDGSEFNAEVARWNLERAINDPKSAVHHLTYAIDSVDVIDPSTIRVNMKYPSSTALLNLSNGVGGAGVYGTSMASKAAVDKGGPDALRNKAVGTGPFVHSQWLSGDRNVYTKWNGYWQNGDDGQPLPYLDGFTARYIPDAAVAYTELRSGSVQAAFGISLSDIAAVKTNPELVYFEATWASFLRFIPALSQYAEPFKGNLKLRQAMWYGLDRDAMVKTLTFGLGKPAYYSQWWPGFLGYDESVPKYDFQLEKAKQLVKDAGYPNGVDVTVPIIANTVNKSMAEVAQAMWAKIGVRVEIQALEKTAATALWGSGKAQMALYGNHMYQDPDSFGRQALVTGSVNNWLNWSNKDFDACIDEGGRVIGNDNKRQEIYKRCLTILMEDAYINSGYAEPRYIVNRSNVKGATWHWIDWDFRRVWLDK